MDAALTDQRSRCSCGHRRCCGRPTPYTIRSGLCSRARELESNIVSQDPRLRSPALPLRMDQRSCYDRASRLQPIFAKPSWRPRTAPWLGRRCAQARLPATPRSRARTELILL